MANVYTDTGTHSFAYTVVNLSSLSLSLSVWFGVLFQQIPSGTNIKYMNHGESDSLIVL